MKTSEISHGGKSAILHLGDAAESLLRVAPATLDLIVTSPPYFVGKEYDTSRSLNDFRNELRRISPAITRALKPGGNICWQVGNHVQRGELTPLDLIVAAEFGAAEDFVLKNRIIWTFGHGEHAVNRFSGRHETILWYSKGRNGYFDLDATRVPQRYPGKKHYKGAKRGSLSGNPLGKNPGDVWDIGEVWNIPNVKSNHIEKTDHPCQFPAALARRLIKALCPPDGIVADPYLGSGTSAVAALLEARNFYGADVEPRYIDIATARLNALKKGDLKVRADVPVATPDPKRSVAQRPLHFQALMEALDG